MTETSAIEFLATRPLVFITNTQGLEDVAELTLLLQGYKYIEVLVDLQPYHDIFDFASDSQKYQATCHQRHLELHTPWPPK
jgi:hypothetical protein